MLEKYIEAACRRKKADIVLKNANYVDVFGARVLKGDIAVTDGTIVGVGEYDGEKEIDCSSKTVTPGFIDSHVHIESSLCSPETFASLTVPRGTSAVVADPHEITNVLGIKGCEYISRAAANTPLEVFLQLPSCVPATPFETSGAELGETEIKKYISESAFFGLGEFMNYPAVISADKAALGKIEAARAAGKIIDGHAPGLAGEKLNAYLCAGISTDHECVTPEEAEEKLSKGMYIQLRHGSTARNLSNAHCINGDNFRRFLICTDDRNAADLYYSGHIDDALRKLVNEEGVDAVRAVICATLNAAECYKLPYRGAVAPGYIADLAVLDDLKDFRVRYVFKKGRLVAKDGAALFDMSPRFLPDYVGNTVRFKKLSAEDFRLRLESPRAKIITLSPGQITTGCEISEIERRGNDVVLPDGVLKLCVIERHKCTGNIGRGLLKGYGFKGGAVALTVAHDSHNLIVAGDDNASMLRAAESLGACGGGMAVASSDGKLSVFPLDIAGIMSSAPVEKIVAESRSICALAREKGVKDGVEPFMSLAFLSLAVIPELKLTDKGLFDVNKFSFTDINADN